MNGRCSPMEVADFARSWVKGDDIFHSHLQVEWHSDFVVLCLVILADDLDHGLWQKRHGALILIRKTAEYCHVGPLLRAVGKLDCNVGKVNASATSAFYRSNT